MRIDLVSACRLFWLPTQVNGLVHISQLADEFVANCEDHVKEGDTVSRLPTDVPTPRTGKTDELQPRTSTIAQMRSIRAGRQAYKTNNQRYDNIPQKSLVNIAF